MKRLILVLLLTLFSGTSIAAEVVKYVNDYLVITLRSGPGNQFKIEKTLGTGTRLTVLEESEDGQYSKVRTGAGTEGWVLNQYLVSEPVARLLLEDAQKQLTKLQAEHKTLRQQFDELSQESSSVSKARNSLEKESEQLNRELEKLKKVAAKPIQLEADNKRLTSEVVELKNNLRLLEEKNTALEDSESRQWVVVGAVILFVGIILGLILPRLKPPRRDSWGGDL